MKLKSAKPFIGTYKIIILLLAQILCLNMSYAIDNGQKSLDVSYADAYNNRGVVLDKLGRYEEALESYDQAIKLNPNHAKAYHNKSIALGKLGRK